MADIHIDREHALGLPAARQIAAQWAQQAETQFGLECNYQEGAVADVLSFSRNGIQGTLKVTEDGFELAAKLGFLFAAFKEKIEAKIIKNLDALIASKPAARRAGSGDKTA